MTTLSRNALFSSCRTILRITYTFLQVPNITLFFLSIPEKEEGEIITG